MILVARNKVYADIRWGSIEEGASSKCKRLADVERGIFIYLNPPPKKKMFLATCLGYILIRV